MEEPAVCMVSRNGVARILVNVSRIGQRRPARTRWSGWQRTPELVSRFAQKTREGGTPCWIHIPLARWSSIPRTRWLDRAVTATGGACFGNTFRRKVVHKPGATCGHSKNCRVSPLEICLVTGNLKGRPSFPLLIQSPANAIVLSSAFSAWRESRRVC